MDKIFEITRNVFVEQVASQQPFTYQKLKDEVIARGGIPLWGLGLTLGRKIIDLEESGYLGYNDNTGEYIPPTREQIINMYQQAQKEAEDWMKFKRRLNIV